MNVQPGQIARIVGVPGCTNKLVTVDRLWSGPRCCASHRDRFERAVALYGPYWLCTALQSIPFPPPGLPADPGKPVAVRDQNLRPLHDGDGEDEMLRIAGRPVDQGVAA